MTAVTITTLDGSQVAAESNQAVVVHGIDEDGNYLGLVAGETAYAVVQFPPPPGAWRWSGIDSAWRPVITLAQTIALGLDTIDKHAGAARLRFITDVPGQPATYLVKAEQAKAFIAAEGQGPVPPYIQAEADATGLTPMQAALTIDGINSLWSNTIGPAIERERRLAKVNLEAATTVEEANGLLTTAIATLGMFTP